MRRSGLRSFSITNCFKNWPASAELSETGRLMAEIDKAIEEHGGWPKAFE
jgi:hypothetical protein